MIINFNSLECQHGDGERLLCEGERNMQGRLLTVDVITVDGAPVTVDDGVSLENVGCKHRLDLSGQQLDCVTV
jgi:hypothetical protein